MCFVRQASSLPNPTYRSDETEKYLSTLLWAVNHESETTYRSKQALSFICNWFKFDNNSDMCWLTVTNHTLACEAPLVYSLDCDTGSLCETWAGTSMCRLFDVNLLWIQEVTWCFYAISAAVAKLTLLRRRGCDTSDVSTVARSHDPHQKKTDKWQWAFFKSSKVLFFIDFYGHDCLFLAKLVPWYKRWQCHPVGRYDTLVQTEISQQLLDRLPLTVLDESYPNWIPMTFVIPWFFL